MGSNMDEAKGRVKEAAGDLTDNDELKREGKKDQGRRQGQGVRRGCEGQGRRRRRQREGQDCRAD